MPRALLHLGLSLGLLIVPTAMTLTILANKDLGPLVSMAYYSRGWFFGIGAEWMILDLTMPVYQSTNSSTACRYPRWASRELARRFRTVDLA